jgi:hypothetical protein
VPPSSSQWSRPPPRRSRLTAAPICCIPATMPCAHCVWCASAGDPIRSVIARSRSAQCGLVNVAWMGPAGVRSEYTWSPVRKCAHDDHRSAVAAWHVSHGGLQVDAGWTTRRAASDEGATGQADIVHRRHAITTDCGSRAKQLTTSTHFLTSCPRLSMDVRNQWNHQRTIRDPAASRRRASTSFIPLSARVRQPPSPIPDGRPHTITHDAA